jgi:AsmA protein
MKKKLLWVCGICLVATIVIVIGLSVVVKSYLRSDKLKALVIPRVEEFTGRAANIDSIDVSLFKGIVVKNIELMERDGKHEFIKAKEFVLDYRLLPLLRKRLVIKKVGLISPFIHLVRDKEGRFNFEDIVKKGKGQTKESAPESPETKGLPLSVETDKISIRDARMEFIDEEGNLPSMNVTADGDLKFSVEKGQGSPELSGDVDIKELSMKRGGAEIKSSGTISIKQKDVEFNITSTIGKDTVKLSGDVKDYMSNPVARLDVNAGELNLENLMALSGGKEEKPKPNDPKPAQRAKSKSSGKDKAAGKRAGSLSASGEVKVGAAKYKGYVMKDFTARYNYTDGDLTINPISTGLAGEKGMILEGSAKGELGASISSGTSAAESLKRTLNGRFSADLTRCEIRESKIGTAIAALTGIGEIRSPKFDTVHFIFTVGKEKIALNGTMRSSFMTLDPSGTVGFDKRMDVAAELRVAPGLAGKLITGKLTSFVTDEKGWTVVPLSITGTTERPSVGLNKAAVTKQIEKGAVQEIKKRLFKGIFGR